MAFTAQDVITRASTILQDTANTRWTVAEQLLWISDALRVIAINHHPSLSAREDLDLVAGTQQALGAGNFRLLRILDGVTRVDRDRLDAVEPGWESGTAAAAPVHYMYDENVPDIFDVYPPLSDATTVAAQVVKQPTAVTTAQDNIPLADAYLPALVDYVLARGFSKHSKAQGNDQRANAAYIRFGEAFGISLKNLYQFSPNAEGVPN